MKNGFLLALLLSSSVMAGSEYDFDYDDKNDMRAAYTMCATTGFIGGDCPKVQVKCWQPPMTYRKSGNTHTYCVDKPNFSVSGDEQQRNLDEASKRAQDVIGNDQ